jgi:ubiquinone/menaquinone biosynthesis C-methylase UbiE
VLRYGDGVSSHDPEQTRQWSDDLSAAWERHRDRLFETQRHVSEWLVDQVDPQPGQTILELAAGPGETGFLAAERLGPEGRLISTDLGAGMVGAAQRGADARGLGNVECRIMDAQEIDLADDSVDGVLCRFGVMLMPEPDRALAGARRVLRPQRRLAYAVWGPPERNPWMTLLVGAVLQNGHRPPGNPFGAGGPFSLAEPAENRARLERAGFDEVEVEELPGSMSFTDVDDYWTLQTDVSGPIALLIAALPEADVAAIRATLEPTLEAFRSPNGFEVPSLAIGLSAR